MKELLKMPGWWLLAEVLTLFIDLTFSFSGHAVVRCICGICTVGILLGLMAQGGHSAANADRRAHRTPHRLRPVLLGLAGAAVPVCLWCVLLAARLGAVPDDFYRLYKLLCAPFLSICNLISADVSAAGVPVWGMGVLLVLSLAPCAAAWIAYAMSAADLRPEDRMYEQ